MVSALEKIYDILPALNLISSWLHSTSLYCVSQKENWNGWCRIYEIYVWINVFFATFLKVLVAFFMDFFWRTSIPWVNWDKLYFAFCSINPPNWRGKPYNFDRLLIAILMFWLKMSQFIKIVLFLLWLRKRLLRVRIREAWISCSLKCSIWSRLSFAAQWAGHSCFAVTRVACIYM